MQLLANPFSWKTYRKLFRGRDGVGGQVVAGAVGYTSSLLVDWAMRRFAPGLSATVEGKVGRTAMQAIGAAVTIGGLSYIKGLDRNLGALAVGALAGGVLPELASLGFRAAGLPVGDWSPYDAGGAWPAMDAAYYQPALAADYPVDIVGEPGQYNTAAVGVWDDSGFVGDEMVHAY